MPATPLFVTRKFPPSVGGMETLAAALWRSLVRVSPQALLVAHGGSNKELPRWLPRAMPRVVWLLARRRADVVLAGDAVMYALLYPVIRLFRVDSGTIVHGLDMTYDNRLYRAVAHFVLRRAPRVIANSAATAEVARSIGVPPERIGVLRLAVTAPEVTAAQRQAAAAELRRRYDLPPDAVVLLTLGRLVERKGSRWFVTHVLPALPADVVHLVAGRGPERDRIGSAAADAGVADRVRIVGQVDDADRELLMQGSDLFVQPNVRVAGDMEGFGLVVLEATLRGTPTVGSALEGILDALVDGETGVLLPPEQPQAWIDRLTALVRDRDGLARLGARFREQARERYGEEQMSEQLAVQLGLRPAARPVPPTVAAD